MSTTPNQPESAVVNYCQNCGKPLVAGEVRTVGGMIYCEPCLAQRLGIPHPANPAPVPGQPYPGVVYPPVRNSPVLAGLLGFIPGVGAMYNGQVAKGLIHVVIFVALISAADHFGPFGILIAAWVFYQVFDAYQTALAMQQGLPVPDHLGLNQIAARFGLPQQTNYTAVPPVQPYEPVPPVPPIVPQPVPPPVPPIQPEVPYSYVPPSAYVPPVGFVPPAGFVPPTAYVPPPAPPVDFSPGMVGLPNEPPQQTLPTGAIVLVALGVFFLLGTAGVLPTHWLSHGWPLILVALGVYIGVKNMNRNPGNKNIGGPQ
jgi:TM2 domain-containing membrane protein YozV